jgi:replicative DNA helicase
MADGRRPDACFERIRDRSIEKAQLGQMLLERQIPEALRILEPADVGDALHRAIYAAICAVQAQGERVDLAPVLDQMRRDKTLNDLAFAGGWFFLYECMYLYAALGRGPLYAQRIAELAGKRG